MNNKEALDITIEAYEYCQKLYNGMSTLINMISQRNLKDLEVYFKNILEGFNWILEVTILTQNYHNYSFDIKSSNDKINKYINGYNNLDLLYVSDVVEYELMPQIEVFYNYFIEIINNLQE
jgi:hypothetical protein